MVQDSCARRSSVIGLLASIALVAGSVGGALGASQRGAECCRRRRLHDRHDPDQSDGRLLHPDERGCDGGGPGDRLHAQHRKREQRLGQAEQRHRELRLAGCHRSHRRRDRCDNGVLPAIQAARDKGIKVVAIDAKTPDGSVDTFVGVENGKAGEQIGQWVVDNGLAQGKSYGVVDARNSFIQNQREDGFRAIVDAAGATYTQSVSGDNVQEKAATAAQNLVTAQPNLDSTTTPPESRQPSVLPPPSRVTRRPRSSAGSSRRKSSPASIVACVSPSCSKSKSGGCRGGQRAEEPHRRQSDEGLHRCAGRHRDAGQRRTVPRDVPVGHRS